MALEVKYEEIRSEVISKLEELSGDMITNLGTLDGIVGEIPGCAEGDVITAYINEYESIVSDVYAKVNNGIAQYCGQLESVCAEFETVDMDMQSQIGGGN